MLIAETPLGSTEFGIGKSKIFMCDDGEAYVIKSNYPPGHDRVISNELIGARLAEWCGLSIPPSRPVLVPKESIPNDWNDLQPGIQFAIRREDTYKNIDASNGRARIVVPFKTVFSECENKNEFVRILTFDMWIGNGDRAGNVGNWLIVMRNGKKYVNVIDHGHAFGGPIRTRILSLDNTFDLAHGQIYHDLASCVPDSDLNPFKPIVNKIESINDAHLQSIFQELPEQWGISAEEFNHISSYLLSRASHLKINIQRIFLTEKRYPSLGKEGYTWSA